MKSEDDKIYEINEAIDKLCKLLAEEFSFKYSKNARSIKKALNNLIFQINFYSNKWNKSGEKIEINAGFYIINKAYGNIPVNNVVAEKHIKPENTWFDISNEKNLNETYKTLKYEFEQIMNLYNKFENNYENALEYLVNEKFDEYNVYIDFILETLDKEFLKNIISKLYNEIPLDEREFYEKNKDEINSKLAANDNSVLKMPGIKGWMFNRGNYKYIIDNNLNII